MKKSLALFATVLAAALNAATPSTSLVYKNTTTNALTGNIVAGNNTTISATGNGTITATALTGNITGNPTISGNLTVGGGTATINGGAGAINTLTLGGNATSDAARVRMLVPSTKYNWQIGAQQNVDNGFEITPSTAVGGTTFSSPAIQIAAATGNTSINYGLTVSGAITGNDGSVVTAASGVPALRLEGTGAANSNYGLRVNAGLSASDYGLFVVDDTATDAYFIVRGDGTAKFWKNTEVAGNLTVSGGTAAISVGNGSAATLQLNQTGVANAYITQKATTGDLAIGNGGGDQLTIAKASGDATFAGQINGNAGFRFRGATGTFYELFRYVGGSNNPGLYVRATEATGTIRLEASGSSGQFPFEIASGGTLAATFNGANATFAGQVNSGTSTSSGYNNNYNVQLEGASGRLIVNKDSASSSGTIYAGFGRNGSGLGSITQDGTSGVLYNTTSDARLKENVRDVTNSGAIIDGLKPRVFDWKNDGDKDRFGFLAQEVHAVFPQAVKKGDDGEEVTDAWAMDAARLVPVLVAELKALRARVASLEAARN